MKLISAMYSTIHILPTQRIFLYHYHQSNQSSDDSVNDHFFDDDDVIFVDILSKHQELQKTGLQTIDYVQDFD